MKRSSAAAGERFLFKCARLKAGAAWVRILRACAQHLNRATAR